MQLGGLNIGIYLKYLEWHLHSKGHKKATDFITVINIVIIISGVRQSILENVIVDLRLGE